MSKEDLQKLVTEALVSMVSAVSGMSPPANEPPPPFIQAGIDRAVSRLSAHIDPLAADAARYRFLRDGERAGLEYWDNEPMVCTDEMSHTGDDLDRVIDNAIDSMRARAAGEEE